MPRISTAISAQDSVFSFESAAPIALVITAVTKAASAVVSATNTAAVGDVIVFGAVTGMPDITGMIGIVTAATGAQLTVGIDTTGFATAGTAGTAGLCVLAEVANVKDVSGFDGSAGEIDVTHMRSAAKEFRQGLQDWGSFSLTLDVDLADPGQMALRAAKAKGTTKVMRWRLPNGKVRAFSAFVKKFGEQAGVDGVVKGSVDLRITGDVSAN